MAHDVPAKPDYVFISYSSKDEPRALAVCHALEEAGIRCWIAPRNVTPGEDWDDEIAKGIEHSTVMVVVFSKKSVVSKHVKSEWHMAMGREIPIIPFRIEPVDLTGGWALYFGRVHWLDAWTPPLESHLKELIQTVNKLVERVERRTQLGSTTEQPPLVDDKTQQTGLSPEYDASAAKIASLFEQADQAEKNRNWSVAIELYEDILALLPGHPDAEKFLARAREKAGMAAPQPVPSPSERPQSESALASSEDVPRSEVVRKPHSQQPSPALHTSEPAQADTGKPKPIHKRAYFLVGVSLIALAVILSLIWLKAPTAAACDKAAQAKLNSLASALERLGNELVDLNLAMPEEWLSSQRLKPESILPYIMGPYYGWEGTYGNHNVLISCDKGEIRACSKCGSRIYRISFGHELPPLTGACEGKTYGGPGTVCYTDSIVDSSGKFRKPGGVVKWEELRQ